MCMLDYSVFFICFNIDLKIHTITWITPKIVAMITQLELQIYFIQHRFVLYPPLLPLNA